MTRCAARAVKRAHALPERLPRQDAVDAVEAAPPSRAACTACRAASCRWGGRPRAAIRDGRWRAAAAGAPPRAAAAAPPFPRRPRIALLAGSGQTRSSRSTKGVALKGLLPTGLGVAALATLGWGVYAPNGLAVRPLHWPRGTVAFT